MSYQVFVDKVNAIARRTGDSARFFIDDKERYIAQFPNNTRIIANATSSRVTVLFGSGHQAMADI